MKGFRSIVVSVCHVLSFAMDFFVRFVIFLKTNGLNAVADDIFAYYFKIKLYYNLCYLFC